LFRAIFADLLLVGGGEQASAGPRRQIEAEAGRARLHRVAVGNLVAADQIDVARHREACAEAVSAREIDARIPAAEREFGLGVEFKPLFEQALRRTQLDDVRTVARAVAQPVVGMGQAGARDGLPPARDPIIFDQRARGAAAGAGVEEAFLPRASRHRQRRTDAQTGIGSDLARAVLSAAELAGAESRL